MCSLNHSQNVLEESPMYSSSHSTLPHLYRIDATLLTGVVGWSAMKNT